MEKDKYVAYVSTYTSGNKSSFGIKIYDVDMNKGRFVEKDQVEITNSSYVTISHNRKYLYSITDFGVEAYKILEDGSLQVLNHASINGMRGCYLSTDYEDRFLFVAGYHDAKVTVLRVEENGTIGEITDEIFHKGLGSIAERNFRPHINCVKMTRDNRFLCAADLGMVYSYTIDEHGAPYFDKIQNISTLNEYHAGGSAASALNFSEDFKYLCSSNAGDNSVILYAIDQKSGMLTKLFCLPVSGDYPKDAALFPDNRHLVSLNHESNSMTFFTVDLKKNVMVMNGPEMKVDQPNCVIFYKLP